MSTAPPSPSFSLPELREVIARHWGFGTLRPLQEQAMRAVLEGRDSLVVLPTGGGKSLCYQAPAVLRGDTTVVVSPLISLMKDQVDSLQACGVPAVQIDSSLSTSERHAAEIDVQQGAVRLLFVSPERLVLTDFCQLLRRTNVRTFAIDEAHCISHWGHDFRPEYRQLSRLKELFPGVSVHGYTATATERVRNDVIEQLGLKSPVVLVGNFDRPNLTYRVIPSQEQTSQVLEVLDRHANEAGIIYCIRRRDVDELTASLQRLGRQALPYHAGLSTEQRKATQDAFAAEKCSLVVATVAFGMGIDRSNLRFVLHTGMPKSLEHYQQETGRAGRDGLEAECVLLHSGSDSVTWRYLIEKAAKEPGVDPSHLPNALRHLQEMDRYCRGAVCRHRALVQYFGQRYEQAHCGACDVCLGDRESVADALVIAQKILSCVARVKERFGVNHVVSVLRGENTEAIRKWAHDQLSTFGLLREHDKAQVRDWVYQLIGQGLLVQQGEQFPVLSLNEQSWQVMRGQLSARLLQPIQRATGEAPRKSTAEAVSWENVDRELFEALRESRRNLAEQRQVPPYVIFSDATLRELARVRPSSLENMRLIYGIGEAKLADFGKRFLTLITRHCEQRGLTRDQPASTPKAAHAPKPSSRLNLQRDQAFTLFKRGASILEVMEKADRKRGTVLEYLCDYIRTERPVTIAQWIPDAVYQRVAAAARQVGMERLKPIFVALGEKVPYDDIRLVVMHLIVAHR